MAEPRTVYNWKIVCSTCGTIAVPGMFEVCPDCPNDAGHTITSSSRSGDLREDRDTIAITKAAPVGESVKVHTHCFSDPTTWYQDSASVVDEVLEDSGNHTLYNVAHGRIINSIGEKMVGRCKKLLCSDGTFKTRWDYFPVIKKNDEVITSGFTIDYMNGTVTFTSANSSEDVIKLTYWYAQSSTFIIRAVAGHTVSMEEARVCLSDVSSLSNMLRFDLFAGHPAYAYPTGDGMSVMNQFTMRYRGPRDFAVNCDDIQDHVLAGFTNKLIEYIFNYTSLIQIKSTQYAALHISLDDDENPPEVEIAIATFSMEITEDA